MGTRRKKVFGALIRGAGAGVVGYIVFKVLEQTGVIEKAQQVAGVLLDEVATRLVSFGDGPMTDKEGS